MVRIFILDIHYLIHVIRTMITICKHFGSSLHIAQDVGSLIPNIAIEKTYTAMPSVTTPQLEIHYLEGGAPDGWPVVLTHGFPYDVHAFDEVVPILEEAGARVLRPYVRGYGPTRFLLNQTMRSGQQAALARDLIEFLDALDVEKAILAGFDWGGVASCTATALHPERVTGLVSYAGYDIMDVKRQQSSFPPSLEAVVWYQHLFQSERGRECLRETRTDLCRLLWQQWSPGRIFDEAEFERTAASFDNPDFVDVVIHAYRFLFGTEPGDKKFEGLEEQLAGKPKIMVPAITLDGKQDPLKPGGTASHAEMFVDWHERREFDCGHYFPKEEPKAFADAIIDLYKRTK